MSLRRYVAVFEINLAGEFFPSELSIQTIDSSKVVMVIDEAAKKIYLWLGAKASQNNKMGARRVVKSAPNFGVRTKGVEYPIGRDCKIVEVDESQKESDSQTRSALAELEALLRKQYMKLAEGVWQEKEISTPRNEEMKPEAIILERRMQFEMSHLEKESMGKNIKRKTEDTKE